MKITQFISSFLLVIALLSGCNVLKYVPEGEKLYTGGAIKLEGSEKTRDLGVVNDELQSLLRPNPNSNFLGMRIGVHAYYKAQTDKSGFINKFMNKKFGEEPVYFSEISTQKTEDLIFNRLENRGFFNSEVETQVKEKEKTAAITYTAKVKRPYRIKSFKILADSFKVYDVIQESLEETLIKPGSRFSLELFKEERLRIDSYLKKKGYYNFNGEFLIFEADTNRYDGNGFDLFLRLKGEIPKRGIVPYQVSEISVFPNFILNENRSLADTTYIDSVAYIQDFVFFRPDRLSTYLLIEEGNKYSARASKLTSDRLSSVGTYKYINIRYDNLHAVNDEDTLGHLKATIELSPLNKRSLRAEVQAVSKSNNFAGPGLTFSYVNRNLFRGGELLSISTNIGYERQISGNFDLSSTQLGLNGEIIIPRLLFPIDLRENFNYSVPKTKIGAGVKFLDRTKLYRLNSALFTFGYNWKSNATIFHDLTPLSINYVKLSNVSDEFQGILDENALLRSSFEQEFIAGLTYTFTLSQIGNDKFRNPIYFSLHTDMAGNALNAISSDGAAGEPATFLGQDFAQYFKSDVDFRYHHTIKGEQKLIGRMFIGAGIPYGNSTSLPFSKQYFSGGPYSVRAFRIRSIGPGTYQPTADDSGSFFDQAGDIRLEGNLEYRFPIATYLKGAVFFDAGNVWLLNENESIPNGQFSSSFVSELAMGAGVGLRIDIQNFVIRFDFASPLKKPWTSFSPEFAPVLNFAIGYPF